MVQERELIAISALARLGRHTAVLAQMLSPGLDEKPLHQLFGVCRVLRDAPRDSAVALALAGNRSHCEKKSGAILGMDPIEHLHHHRPPLER